MIILLTILITILSYLISFILGSYLLYLGNYFKEDDGNNTFILFLGGIIGLSINLAIGFLLSKLGIFYEFLQSIIYITCIGILNGATKNFTSFLKQLVKELHIKSITIGLLILFLFGFSLFSSNFPLGYDKGKHIGVISGLIRRGQLNQKHPGSLYTEYYFPAPYIIFGSLMINSKILINYKDSDYVEDAIIINTGFNTTLLIIFMNYIVFIFLLSKSRKVWILSLGGLLLVSLSGLINAGSIGTYYTLLFLSCLVYYIGIGYNKHKVDVIIIGLLVSLFVIHPISLTISLLFCAVYGLNLLIKRQYIKIYHFGLECAISLLLAFLLILIAYPILFFGFKEALERKYDVNNLNMKASVLEQNKVIDNRLYVVINLEDIYTNYKKEIYLIGFLSFLGYLSRIAKRNSLEGEDYKALFVLTIALYLIIPISPLIKTGQYFPFLLFVAISFINIKNAKWISMFFLLSLVVYINSYKTDFFKFKYINDKTYQAIGSIEKVIKVSIKNNKKIIIPDSGALGYFMSSNIDNTYIAEPRYPDMPQWVENSKLYDHIVTNKGVFSEPLTGERLKDFVTQNNIGYIVYYESAPIDINEYKKVFSHIISYQVGLNYMILVLD